MASGVVTISQSYDKRTLTGTPSESTIVSEKTFGSTKASGSEEASYSHVTTGPNTSVHLASPEEADSANSTSAPLTDVPVSIVDQPNRWCIEGQYQIYRDAKMLNDKGVTTQILTVERQVL